MISKSFFTYALITALSIGVGVSPARVLFNRPIDKQTTAHRSTKAIMTKDLRLLFVVISMLLESSMMERRGEEKDKELERGSSSLIEDLSDEARTRSRSPSLAVKFTSVRRKRPRNLNDAFLFNLT